MNMQTSYFAKYRGSNAVSIAAVTPVGFTGRIYDRLAPPKQLLFEYKRTGDRIAYENIYRNIVLSKLEAKTIYKQLGIDSVLLCYEAPECFCHRHIVAKWFNEQLGITVNEVAFSDYSQLSFFNTVPNLNTKITNYKGGHICATVMSS
jgi:hypothetical protein